MAWVFGVIKVLHIIVSLFLILVVLLQAGKGAGVGFALGGASQAVFGGGGATTFLAKLTWVTAFIFMVTSISLAWRSSRQGSSALKEKSAPTSPDKLLEAAADEDQDTKDATGQETSDATQQGARAGRTADATPQAPVVPSTRDASGTATKGKTPGAAMPATRPQGRGTVPGMKAPARGAVAPVARPMAPARGAMAPTARPMAPARGAVAPAARPMAPARGAVAPAARPMAPARGAVAPVARPMAPRSMAPAMAPSR